MAEFWVEFPHGPEPIACERIAEVYLKTGPRFLAYADWGYGEYVRISQ